MRRFYVTEGLMQVFNFKPVKELIEEYKPDVVVIYGEEEPCGKFSFSGQEFHSTKTIKEEWKKRGILVLTVSMVIEDNVLRFRVKSIDNQRSLTEDFMENKYPNQHTYMYTEMNTFLESNEINPANRRHRFLSLLVNLDILSMA